jgi:hypothetical membrane protein
MMLRTCALATSVATVAKRSAVRYPNLGFGLFASCGQYFVVQAVVASRWSTPYSLKANTISDLGNTACGRFSARPVCSPLHALMNLSFLALGLSMAIGSILIYYLLPARRSSRWGFRAMAVAGLGVVLVGLFPENTVSTLHGIGAALPFTIGNVAVVALGLALPLPRSLRIPSVLAGTLALVALVSYASNIDWGLGAGGMERIVAYPQTVWLIVVGLYFLFRGPARSHR